MGETRWKKIIVGPKNYFIFLNLGTCPSRKRYQEVQLFLNGQAQGSPQATNLDNDFTATFTVSEWRRPKAGRKEDVETFY